MKQDVKISSNSVSYLKRFLSDNPPRSIFLVTGKDSFLGSGAYDKLAPILKPYKHYRFFDFEENPKVEDVERGIELFNCNKCDLIIAVGGGSVIDMAKLVNIYHSKKGDISQYILSAETEGKVVPFVALPTTSGTGSEATHFAVVYVQKKKYSVANKLLLPDLVLIEPSFTYSASPYLTAVTGLDAFAQAIESYWSVNSTIESLSYSIEAIKIIWDHLPSAVNKRNKEAKNMMSRASHLAGKAINIAKTTAPHALSYGFTTNLKMAHGHAVSLFLPFFMDFHTRVAKNNCKDVRGIEWVKEKMTNIANKLEIETEQLATETLRFINRCDISINFNELNITKEEFEQAIGNFSEERLKNNPLRVDHELLKNLYNSKFNSSGY
jgi:alcohol dehydrogenase class IV